MVNILNELLGQRSKVSILRLLICESVEISGREIARKTGLSPKSAHKTLVELKNQGVVSVRVTGNTYLFKINPGHYFVESILAPLFMSEKELFSKMVEAVKKSLPLKTLISLILFGSVARGESKTLSDIDLLLVVKDKKDKLSLEKSVLRKNTLFQDKFGLAISPYVLSVEEFIKKFNRKDGIIREILRDGLVIWGKKPSEILMR